MTTTLLTSTTDRLCDTCSTPIASGEQAAWDAPTGRIECVDCASADERHELILASVARSRRLPTGPEPESVVREDVGAVSEVPTVDAVDDDATPVFGMARPTLPAEDGDDSEAASLAPPCTSSTMAPPIGMPSVPPSTTTAPPAALAGPAGYGGIAPLAPPSHDALVEQPLAAPPSIPMGAPGSMAAPIDAVQVDVAQVDASPLPTPNLPTTAEPAAPTEVPITALIPTLPAPASAGAPNVQASSPFAPPAVAGPDGPLAAASENVVVLNNRKVPRVRLTVDRIIVSPSGVWVVDDRSDRGRVGVAPDRRGAPKLQIGGRDRSRILRKAEVAGHAVGSCLGDLGFAYVQVRRVFCFSRATLDGNVEQRQIDGVQMMSTAELDAAVGAAGPVDPSLIATLAERLGELFVPA